MSAEIAFGVVTATSPLMVLIDGDEAAVRVSRRTATVSINDKVILLGRDGATWTAIPWVAA